MKVLNIQTADEEIFKVDMDVARQSVTIRTMLDNLGIEEDNDSEDTIPILKDEVTGAVFEKCLVWMEKNRGKPDYADDDVDGLKLLDWEKDFVDMPVPEMFAILIAGDFLEIKGLINLMCKALALQIQENSVEKIREIFEVEDPKWTPEELSSLKEENAWAYEQAKK